MLKIVNKKKWILSSILVITLLTGTLLLVKHFTNCSGLQIQSYKESRDRDFIFAAFKGDLYWLVENPEFDINYMLTTNSPNKNPKFTGKLTMKLLFLDCKPIAFTTYYMKSFYEGQIQFLYVAPDYRGKGYVAKLLEHDMYALKKQGAAVVKLVTRTNNAPAIKAYTKFGFRETSRDEGFVYFEKMTES